NSPRATTFPSGARRMASGNGSSTSACRRHRRRIDRDGAEQQAAKWPRLGAPLAYACCMLWQSLATVALDVDSGIAPERARAITEALCRRIIALLVNRGGRAEPLASACLYWSDGHLILLTCRHVFEGGASL